MEKDKSFFSEKECFIRELGKYFEFEEPSGFYDMYVIFPSDRKKKIMYLNHTHPHAWSMPLGPERERKEKKSLENITREKARELIEKIIVTLKIEGYIEYPEHKKGLKERILLKKANKAIRNLRKFLEKEGIVAKSYF